MHYLILKLVLLYFARTALSVGTIWPNCTIHFSTLNNQSGPPLLTFCLQVTTTLPSDKYLHLQFPQVFQSLTTPNYCYV